MNERAYTVSEIDDMRQAIELGYPSGVPYYQDERTREVEERIRTYMVGGVDPQEVIKKCPDIMALQQAFQQRVQQEYQK